MKRNWWSLCTNPIYIYHLVEISKPTVRISTLPSSTFINESRKSDKKKRLSNNPFRDQSLNLNHIHFNESGEISTTTNTIQNKENVKSVDTIVIYQCDLNLIDPKEPRIFSIRSSRNIDDKAINKNPKKPVIEIQENILIKPILEINNSSQEFENTLEAKINVTSLADTSSLISNAKENTGNVSDRSLNNTNNTCTKIDKYPAETEDKSELKICETDTISTANDETTTDKTKIEESASHTADIYDDNDGDDLKPENESSILSVDSQLDCVDLSIDVDEEDVDVKNKNGKDSEMLKTFKKVHVQDISISDTSDVEEVIDLNETEDQNNSSLNTTCRRSSLSSIIKINRIIAYCKDTKELPDVGDVMIFKVSEWR